MATMASKIGLMDSAHRETGASNHRRGSFEGTLQDGVSSPQRGRRGSAVKVHPGPEDEGGEAAKSRSGKFREAPPSFFKKVLARVPSRSTVEKWDGKVVEEDDEGMSCSELFRELCSKVPIKHLKVIRPDSYRKRQWVRLIMVATLYSVVLNPIQISFDLDNMSLTILIIDVICDLLFVTDIYVITRTAVVLDNKYLKQPKQILKYHSMSFNFYLDVISSFPTGIMQLILKSNAWRTVRILKVLRLSKVGRILKEFSPDKFNTSDMQRLLILLFYLLVATHLLACGYVMINRVNEWPPHFFIQGADPDDIYQTYTGAVCWSLMSLTGIGAILTPISIGENIFVLVTILVGVFVYAIILGNVYSTLANQNYLETAYLRKVSSVLEFCKYRNVPEETQRKVTMYYRLMWSRNKGIQNDLLLEDMTKPLRQEILMHSFKNVFNRCKWIKNVSEHHKKILAESLRNEIYMPKEVIINSGESPQYVLLVSRGTIGVIAASDHEGGGKGQSLVGTLRDGSVYGIYHVAKNYLHNATLSTQTFVEVAVLYANDYLELRRVIPQLEELEEAHLKNEIGDINPAKRKKRQQGPAPPNQTINLGRKYEDARAHRRDSLATKLIGLLQGSGSPGGAQAGAGLGSGRRNSLIVDIDNKATLGMTNDLFEDKEERRRRGSFVDD